MPSGFEYTEYSSTQDAKDVECEQQDASRGNGEILLSKTSLGHHSTDTSPLADFFGGSSCTGSHVSPSFVGEPATPNGAGDFVISYSPVSSLPTGYGYSYGHTPMVTCPENLPENNNFARRSCGCQSDGPTALFNQSAQVLALRHNRFHSGAGYDESGASSSLFTSAVIGTSASYLPTSTICQARLEQELQQQCEENQRLRQKLQEYDEQLSALRAELRHLKAERGRACAPPGAMQQEDPPLLSMQLQRVPRKVDGKATESVLGRSSHGGVFVSHSTQMDGGSSSYAEDVALLDSSLLRLDPPPRGHVYETLSFSRTLSDEVQVVSNFSSAGLRNTEQLQHLVNQEHGALKGLAPQLQSDALPSSDAASADVKANAGKACCEREVAALDVSLGVHTLLIEERQRTDRAHSALFFSSQQAARLAQQLSEAQIRAAALYEELKDWRSACLDNHRELAKQRRAAAATIPAVEAQPV